MATAVLEPVAPPVDGGDDPPAHYWCCTDQVALCGADLTGTVVVDVDDDDAADCLLCVYMLDEDVPCSPDCRDGGA